MGQVRWAGWTVAIATALVISGGQVVRADVQSDRPAAIVVYPDIDVDVSGGVDTVIRLTNTNQLTPILAWCFFVDANSHCSGGTNDGHVCTTDPSLCAGGFCVPGWQETDFRITLTASQPIEWLASQGLADGDLPLASGVCQRNPLRACGGDSDCNPFPGGTCTQSNAGTRIPPVPEDPFEGELRCIAIDSNGVPVARNDLKGEGILETATTSNLDVASYNAIGIQATGAPSGATNELVIGPGSSGEYNGCPNYLILNHFFDDANDPVPNSQDTSVTTDLVLVPCSADYLRQIPGAAVVQYLVFNEFEQRFSTSKTVKCFQEIQLCNIDTPQCSNSIFNVAVAGTLTGQTRLNPIGIPIPAPNAAIPSGLLGIAVEHHSQSSGLERSAAFNLHMQGQRDAADTITIP
jgi:hypothetical protein